VATSCSFAWTEARSRVEQPAPTTTLQFQGASLCRFAYDDPRSLSTEEIWGGRDAGELTTFRRAKSPRGLVDRLRRAPGAKVATYLRLLQEVVPSARPDSLRSTHML